MGSIPFITLSPSSTLDFASIVKHVGCPFFIKPSSLGSSVGVARITNESEFKDAVVNAFLYDNKIIAEEAISGREIECSILGNEDVEASLVGEVIVSKNNHEFYSFDAKYVDKQGARIDSPANVPDDLVLELQKMSIDIFKVLECCGMARIDFFIKSDGGIFINEINTIPGFTTNSMYPRLWEASGLGYS